MKGGRKNCDKKRHTGGTVTMNQNPVSLTYDWDTEWGKATAFRMLICFADQSAVTKFGDRGVVCAAANDVNKQAVRHTVATDSLFIMIFSTLLRGAVMDFASRKSRRVRRIKR